MKIFQFFRREARIPLGRLAAMAVVSALASVLILVVVNIAVQHAVEDTHNFQHLLLFLLGTGLYIVAQRYLLGETSTEVEKILQRIRVRIVDKVRDCDLEPMEALGRSQIYTCLSREGQTISQGSTFLVMGLQSTVLILFATLYLAWLSVPAFVTFAGVTVLTLMIHRNNTTRFQQSFLQAMDGENKLLDTLSQALDGFSEVKINPRRGDDLFDRLHHMIDVFSNLRMDVKMQLSKVFIFGQTMLYLLVAAMIFVVPRLSETHNDTIVQAATVMLFLTGPISNLAGSMPDFANTQAAIEKLESLEVELDAAAGRPGGPPEAQITPFRELRLEGAVFQFQNTKSERPFTLGPLDMTLEAGETVFIVGGNGSGKTTLLRLLTALYYPERGVIRVNGQAVGDGNLQAYRNLFSVIFAECHIFDRLYGLQDVEAERVTELLEEMEIAHKTNYRDGEFSTVDLSTGQRKRLAYIVSLLEDRPIYVFDEWAAGQDPEFRKKFYGELLPQLKARGKTVLAVTHDDRYWDAADRLLKMEEGRFVEV